MHIGINYLSEREKPYNRYDKAYEILLRKKYIDTLKFPGKYCDLQSLEFFLNFTEKNNCNKDIHGLVGMYPYIYADNMGKNIDWTSVKKVSNIDRISTHIGIEKNEKLKQYSKNELLFKLKNNLEILRKINKNIEIGLENTYCEKGFDIEVSKPNFISETWEKADFGVFDIAHAKIAARQLNVEYKEYLEILKNKEKVKIIHVSGNEDKKNMYHCTDKHLLISENEIEDILYTLDEFKNYDLIVSEYANNGLFSYEKEIIIEAVVLNTIVKTRNFEKSKEILKFLSDNLNEDISNYAECI